MLLLLTVRQFLSLLYQTSGEGLLLFLSHIRAHCCPPSTSRNLPLLLPLFVLPSEPLWRPPVSQYCHPSYTFTDSMNSEQLRTTVTDLLKINHPIMLAGMNVAAGPKLAAAVTNAGGLGVIGGVGYTPDMLREQIAELKSFLKDKNAPFGVDLLIPQVGGNARKTK